MRRDLRVVSVVGGGFHQSDELSAAADVDELRDRCPTLGLSLDVIRHVAALTVAHRTCNRVRPLAVVYTSNFKHRGNFIHCIQLSQSCDTACHATNKDPAISHTY